MKEQGKGGSIIQMASIYGVMGPEQHIYVWIAKLTHLQFIQHPKEA